MNYERVVPFIIVKIFTIAIFIASQQNVPRSFFTYNNVLIFLNYAIKQKEFSFTMSEITSKLNLQITPL